MQFLRVEARHAHHHVNSVSTPSPSDGDTRKVKEQTEERITKGKGNSM